MEKLAMKHIDGTGSQYYVYWIQTDDTTNSTKNDGTTCATSPNGNTVTALKPTQHAAILA